MKLLRKSVLLISLTLTAMSSTACRTPLEKAAKSLDKVESSLERWGTTSVSRVLLLENKEQFKVDIDGKTTEYVGNAKSEFQGAASRFSERVFESKTSEATRNINGSDVIDTEAGKSSNLPEKIGVKDTLANDKFKDFLALLSAPSTISDADALKIGISTKVSENLLKFFTNPKDLPSTETAFLGVLQVSCNPGWFTEEDYIGGVIVTPEYAISSEELSDRLTKMISDLKKANKTTKDFEDFVSAAYETVKAEVAQTDSKSESLVLAEFRKKLYSEARIPARSAASELGTIYGNKNSQLKAHFDKLNKWLEEYKNAKSQSIQHQALIERVRKYELGLIEKESDTEIIKRYLQYPHMANGLSGVQRFIAYAFIFYQCNALLSLPSNDPTRRRGISKFKTHIKKRFKKISAINLLSGFSGKLAALKQTIVPYNSPLHRVWNPLANASALVSKITSSLNKIKVHLANTPNLEKQYKTFIAEFNSRFPKGAKNRQDYQTLELYRAEVLKAAGFTAASALVKPFKLRSSQSLSYQKALKDIDAKIEKNTKAKESKKSVKALANRIRRQIVDYIDVELRAELLGRAKQLKKQNRRLKLIGSEKPSNSQNSSTEDVLSNLAIFRQSNDKVWQPQINSGSSPRDSIRFIRRLQSIFPESSKRLSFKELEEHEKYDSSAEVNEYVDAIIKAMNLDENLADADTKAIKLYKDLVSFESMIEASSLLGSMWQSGHHRPAVQSVFPLVEAQTLDLKNSNRDQVAWANYLSVALASTGYTSQSEQLTEYVNRLQNDSATRTATPVLSAFTTGTSFGYDFQPVFQALRDPSDLDSEAAHKLHPSTAPAMVLVLVEKEEQQFWTRVKFNVSSRWRPIEGPDSFAWQIFNYFKIFGSERGWLDWSKGKLENSHRFEVTCELDNARSQLLAAKNLKNTHRYLEMKRRYTALSNLGQGIELFTKMPPAPTKASMPDPKPITVTNCEPTLCVANRDSYLVIQGTNFKQDKTNNVSRVTVGSIDCKFEVVSASILVAQIPKDSFKKSTTHYPVVVSGRINVAAGLPSVEFNIEGKEPDKNPQIGLQYNSANKITGITISNIGGSRKEILKALSKLVRENRVSNEVNVDIDVDAESK